ncbi:MAG: hypothetical protein NT138_17715 [Planctomycetales bacterium]|nr:hypothetical protein [Planctomycetales bacterium]
MKLGKQDAKADFAFVDLGGDFINSSFGLIPTVPLATWPNPGMGAAVFLNLTDRSTTRLASTTVLPHSVYPPEPAWRSQQSGISEP